MLLTSKAEIDELHVMSIFKSFFPRIKASEKSNKALQGEIRDRQRLSRVIRNLGMFSEVTCNRFMDDVYLLCVLYRL